MSREFRQKAQKPKIQLQPVLCSSEQFPHISFRYLTSNKRHSLEYLQKCSVADRAKTMEGLLRRLEEITKSSWTKLGALPKENGGYETISARQLRFSGTDANKEDNKVWVFRFDTWQGHDKGRIIGFKDSPCSAFFVNGFDFDFSAYSHS